MTTPAVPLDTSACSHGQGCYVDPDYGIMLCSVHTKVLAPRRGLRFVQIVTGAAHDGHVLYGLDVDGRVWRQHLTKNAVWRWVLEPDQEEVSGG